MNRELQIRFYNCQLNELDSLKEYLEKKAAQGWMLEKRKGSICYFRKCKPKKVKFSVEIFDKASEFMVDYNATNEEYIEYCKAAGWNFVSAEGKVQIFYTEDKSAIPIETDPQQKFETVHKSIFKQYIKNWFIGIILGLLYLIKLSDGIVEIFSSYMSFSIILLGISMVILNTFQVIIYYRWFHKIKEKIKNGEEFYYYKNLGSLVSKIMVACIGTAWFVGVLVVSYLSGDKVLMFILLIFVSVPIFLFGSSILSVLTQKNGIMKEMKQTIYYKVIIIITFAVTGGIIIFFIAVEFFGLGNKNIKNTKYIDTDGTISWEAKHNDSLIFTLEDMGIKLQGEYNKNAEKGDSFIISKENYYEEPLGEDTEKDYLAYTIYRVKNKWLYDKVVKEVTKDNEFDFNKLEMIHIQGYKVYHTEDAMHYHSYLLLMDNLVLDLQTNLKLNEKQLQIVINKLD
ncbi:DUF2812 domain-containing protein [Anaerosacchariphilus polymeriproducens]|uniref:DUF2812 domain-containing protein n=1 Tax=Anaerosacchariphilus polymeriproducens TaxID=1812858 RepID=A0A371AY97_9FIRM|nr:DUF2812 domain-containing protein [Anaerosacchariphilus polymeriproducens]RDU24564.1 DUF2812 domain-containing protein [Anaerosacchariphilus polymeriproducens]